MMICFCYIVALLALAVGTENVSEIKSLIQNRIYDGQDGQIEDVPYQVLLWDGNNICGGAIISPEVILTAAHCIFSKSVESIEIRAGSSYWKEGGVTRKVARKIIHEGYTLARADYNNDIGLLILSEKLEYSSAIQPAKLPNEFDDILINETAVIAGWGKIDRSSNASDILKIGCTRIANRSECEGKLPPAYRVTERMICTHDLATSCPGDSGGALTKNGIVYGVCSIGICGQVTVYTRVSVVRKWIKDNVDL